MKKAKKKTTTNKKQKQNVKSFTIRISCKKAKILPEHKENIIEAIQQALDDDSMFGDSPWMDVTEVNK